MALYFGSFSHEGGLAYVPAHEVAIEIVEPGERAPHGCILVDAPPTQGHTGLHVEVPLVTYRHALASVTGDEAAGRRTVIWP